MQQQRVRSTDNAVSATGILLLESLSTPKTIEDAPFDLAYLKYHPERYSELLQGKVSTIKKKFEGLLQGVQLETCTSVEKHYRLRCRFAVVEWDKRLYYAMWENGRPSVLVKQFPVASAAINILMPKLLHRIDGSDIDGSVLRNGLRAINFLNTLAGDMVVTLIYATELNPEMWKAQADRVLVWNITVDLFTEMYPVLPGLAAGHQRGGKEQGSGGVHAQGQCDRGTGASGWTQAEV